MSEMTFKELIEQLKAWGVIFDKGLSTQEIRGIESDGNFSFPDDLKEFLSLALPLWQPDYEDHGPYITEVFPNWRTRGSLLIRISQRWLLRGIQFHVETGYIFEGQECGPKGYWSETWGQRPSTSQEALAIVEKVFSEAPILIPIYAHRFIPSEPTWAGNPVFSVAETDIIHYGPNLTKYLLKEFGRRELALPESSPRSNPIRFWDDFLSFPKQQRPSQNISLADVDLSQFDDLT